jgi:hypothetical protein
MDEIDVGMSFYGTRQFRVYGPSYPGLGMVAANRGWQGQRLNDIAQRTQTYDQYLLKRIGWNIEYRAGR